VETKAKPRHQRGDIAAARHAAARRNQLIAYSLL